MPEEIKVLIVEDDEIHRRTLGAILKKYGVSHQAVENGREAIQVLKGKMFDVVLMDVEMPVMDGYEALHHIRYILQLEIPVIMMTGHARPDGEEKLRSAGMNGYLTKPFSPDLLHRKILEITEDTGRKPLPENSPSIASKGAFHLDYLEDITGGNRDMISEMIILFLGNVSVEMGAFYHASERGDRQTTQFWAHKMKSSFATMGLLELAAELREIEADTTDLQARVKNIVLQWEKTYPEFLAFAAEKYDVQV